MKEGGKMNKKTLFICGVLTLGVLALSLLESGLKINVYQEPETYVTDPILVIKPSGERVYMSQPGGILNGDHVIMSNPNAGDLMLNINGPTYTKKIKIWDTK
jgi:hypothetical protein